MILRPHNNVLVNCFVKNQHLFYCFFFKSIVRKRKISICLFVENKFFELLPTFYDKSDKFSTSWHQISLSPFVWPKVRVLEGRQNLSFCHSVPVGREENIKVVQNIQKQPQFQNNQKTPTTQKIQKKRN